MPIEVTAQLDRDSAVYLAGEAIHCKVHHFVLAKSRIRGRR